MDFLINNDLLEQGLELSNMKLPQPTSITDFVDSINSINFEDENSQTLPVQDISPEMDMFFDDFSQFAQNEFNDCSQVAQNEFNDFINYMADESTAAMVSAVEENYCGINDAAGAITTISVNGGEENESNGQVWVAFDNNNSIENMETEEENPSTIKTYTTLTNTAPQQFQVEKENNSLKSFITMWVDDSTVVTTTSVNEDIPTTNKR